MQLRDNMLKLYNEYQKVKQDEIDMMIAKPKSYNGPALEFNNPDEAVAIREREMIAQKMLQWNGDEDVEKVSEAFLDFLWSSSKTTARMIKEKKLAD